MNNETNLRVRKPLPKTKVLNNNQVMLRGGNGTNTPGTASATPASAGQGSYANGSYTNGSYAKGSYATNMASATN